MEGLLMAPDYKTMVQSKLRVVKQASNGSTNWRNKERSIGYKKHRLGNKPPKFAR
jgi:hypothetical protein